MNAAKQVVRPHRARPLTCDVERIWYGGRERDRGPIRPSPGIAAVVLALDTPLHGGAVAKAASQDQGNVVRWLDSLSRLGLAQVVDTVPGLGRNGGGRPAVIWALTGRGRELADALRAEANTPLTSFYTQRNAR